MSETQNIEYKSIWRDEFLLQKYGRKWDSIAIPNVSVSDLKQETFDFFKEKGIESKRINKESRKDTSEQILNNLNLIDNGHLKRAALLLFHPDPEKFVTGAFIKIGFFRTDSDLLFQDDIHGNLFEQVERTMELLLTKYIKAMISYKGLSRIETYEYPEESLRETLLNAIAHKDYAGCTPIQISVYQDKVMFWNIGQLPENWTIDMLQQKHSSIPYNPALANAFFRSGYIEAWGRGIEKINRHCTEAGLPVPLISYNHSGCWVEFRKNIYNHDSLKELGLNERQIKAVLYVKEKGRITNLEYLEINKEITDRTALRDLDFLIEKGVFQRIGEKKASYYKLINVVNVG